MSHHLAQLNVGRARDPLDSDTLAGFMAALDPINALADAAPGFVWRLQTEDGNATAVKVDPDPQFIINLSVWASLEQLGDFVYQGEHLAILRQRRQWFERVEVAVAVLWWVPAGTVPTASEAMDRLARLRRDGPTREAFTFRRPFPPPGGDDADVPADEGWTCPA